MQAPTSNEIRVDMVTLSLSSDRSAHVAGQGPLGMFSDRRPVDVCDSSADRCARDGFGPWWFPVGVTGLSRGRGGGSGRRGGPPVLQIGRLNAPFSKIPVTPAGSRKFQFRCVNCLEIEVQISLNKNACVPQVTNKQGCKSK